MGGENQGTEVPGEITPEVQEKAKRMGWVPQDQFKGDDSVWIDADKFLERGENELPIMRERYRKLDKTVTTLNGTIKHLKKTFGEFQKYHTKVAERAYDKAMEDLTSKQREAVKDGDTAAFDKIEKAKSELKPDAPEIEALPDENDPEVQGQKVFDDWVSDGNEWYTEDKFLQGVAATTSIKLQNEKGLIGRKLYDAVREDLEARYPERFGNENRGKPNSVMGGGEAPPPKGKRNFAALPKDAQTECKRFVKEIPGFTKEQYVKDYQWE